jgi:hypothetical protein
MRVLVTGGRDFRNREWLFAGLDLLNEVSGGITELIEGGASGADCLAANWAIWKKDRTGKPEHTKVPAEWGKHGRSAGYIRNIEMAQMDPDVVLACPGGRGTANMVSVARARGIRVVFLEKMPVAKGAPCATDAPRPVQEIAA